AGIFLAKLLAQKKLWFKKFIHACLYSGWLMPEAATAFIFFFLFSIDGEVNQLLILSGNVSRVWLTDSPLLVIALAHLWSGTAFSLIIYETALDLVPEILTDSARCDGANSFQVFFCITIPSLADTIRSNTAILILNNLGVFGLIFMLTGGGPMLRSTTFPLFVFRNAISGSDTGYGMALSFILFAISIVISLAHVTIVNQGNKEIEC
ncbi:MAG TPA: sugar ABC transporter permease, partial [Treponemataceae bacterium]|nr:sugar ABC transporter permease [Treponemataceae bacterium]